MNLISKYPDGSSYATCNTNLKKIIFRINTYEDLWHLNQVVDAYAAQDIRPTIVIPWLIDGQADRRFSPDQSSGLTLVCKFLDKMPADFEIFHPHNAEVVEALIKHVNILNNSYFINSVLTTLASEKRPGKTYSANPTDNMEKLKDNLILMSTDAGGFKPLIKLTEKIKWPGEIYSASKARSWSVEDGTKFIQQIDRTDFQGKDVLLIDDLCIYGGTAKNLAKMLKERNCGKLYLAVSHMTVQNLGNDPVTNYFERVFTTNSKYKEYCIIQNNFTVPPSNLTLINL